MDIAAAKRAGLTEQQHDDLILVVADALITAPLHGQIITTRAVTRLLTAR